MKSTVMIVTPEMAKKWLDNNTANRRIDVGRVRKYKEMMQRGWWETNGESICFDEAGRLRNGQHRLIAMVEANVTLELVIVTDVPYTTNTFDVGKNRTDMDYASLRSIDTTPVINAAAGLVYNEAGSKIDIRAEKMDYIERDLEDWRKMYVCLMHGGSHAILKKAGCLAALFMAYRSGKITEKQADAFCQITNSGLPIVDYISDAPLILRKTLEAGIKIDVEVKGGSSFMKACVEVTYKAIDDFANCRHPKKNYRYTGKTVEICKEYNAKHDRQMKIAI